MCKYYNILVLYFVVVGCNNSIDYSKKDALSQSYNSLKIKHKIGVISNQRNDFILELSEYLEIDKAPPKSLLDTISKLSSIMDLNYAESKKFINQDISNHNDSRFYDATLNYLKANKQVEEDFALLLNQIKSVSSLRDSSFIELRTRMNNSIRILLNEEVKYEKQEIKFYTDHNIYSTQVDSIVNIIKS